MIYGKQKILTVDFLDAGSALGFMLGSLVFAPQLAWEVMLAYHTSMPFINILQPFPYLR